LELLVKRSGSVMSPSELAQVESCTHRADEGMSQATTMQDLSLCGASVGHEERGHP